MATKKANKGNKDKFISKGSDFVILDRPRVVIAKPKKAAKKGK